METSYTGLFNNRGMQSGIMSNCKLKILVGFKNCISFVIIVIVSFYYYYYYVCAHLWNY